MAQLYRRIVSQASEFLSFETVYLITDNRDLLANTVTTNPGPEPLAGGCCLVEREDQVCWPLRGAHDSVFVPISSDTGLERVHPTWAGTYILDACVYLFSGTNFALIDSDCVPVTLYEIQELWRSCDDFDHTNAPLAPDHTPTNPIAPAHKRARSVDTGKATQQPGPPAKLPKSRSVENLVSAPTSTISRFCRQPGEGVDYGDSDEHSHHHLPKLDLAVVPLHRLPSQATPEAASIIPEESRCHPTKGVILVSEAFTEINAGLVIILASGHESPIAEADLADPNRDPDEIAAWL